MEQAIISVWQILCFVERDVTISLYPYDVCIDSGSREKNEILVRETSNIFCQFLLSRRELL